MCKAIQEVDGHTLIIKYKNNILHPNGNVNTKVVSTPSYESIIKPINTRAIGRWKNFKTPINKINSLLLPFVEKYRYT